MAKSKKPRQSVIIKAAVPLENISGQQQEENMASSLRNVPGILSVSVSAAAETVFLSFDASVISKKEIEDIISGLGFTPLAFFEENSVSFQKSSEKIKSKTSAYFRRLIVAVSIFLSSAAGEKIGFSSFVFCVLSFIAWAVAGWHFHKGYFAALRVKKSDMNTIVSVSSSAMFFYSLAITLFPDLSCVYKPSWHYLPLMLSFLNFGLWIESRHKEKNFEISGEMLRFPSAFARRLGDRGEETVPSSEIKAGDLLLIRPAEQLSADGHVVKGLSAVDESRLTGESVPAAKAPGSSVYAGTINQTGWLEFVADAVGEDTAIMRIAMDVNKSRAYRTEAKKISDKISAWFMPSVFFFAFVSAVAWMLFSWDYRMSLGVFAAIISAACPCAAGIAVPMAIGIGFARSKKLGVSIRSYDIVDAAKSADSVIFDKTGTLTDGTLEIKSFSPYGISENDFFRLMAIAEEKSEHPLAAAVRAESKNRKIFAKGILAFTSYPGRGIKVSCEEGEIMAGSLLWFSQEKIDIPENIRNEAETSPCSILMLAVNREFKGYASFAGRLRPNAAQVVRSLKKMKITPVLASGDSSMAVEYAAKEAGIDICHSGVFPYDKRDIIRRYKALGKSTVMVGDGFNDAPALASADIGISMRSGSGLAAEASDVMLMHDDLQSVVSSLLILRRIRRTVKQNMTLAFVFNAAFMPLMAGILYPLSGWIASPQLLSVPAAFGVLSVAINSMRLRRMKS